MQITKKILSPTKVKLTLVADEVLLSEVKLNILRELRPRTKVQGFRAGKVPIELVEKNVDPATLQSEFIDGVLNRMYSEALAEEKLRPVSQPEVSVSKFVPYTTLEAEIEVEVIGDIKLPDYKKLRVPKPAVKIEAKDIDEVLTNLRTRAAEKKEVKRGAKDGDEVTIDFDGADAKTKEPISGGSGKDYALVIGSNSFIPGFEPELIGLKAGDSKSFTVTFPKDYGVKDLQSKKVVFDVTVHKVEELATPKLDDAFAATVGPFATLSELKADIKKQLQAERETQAERDYESEVLAQIAEKTTVEIPKALVDEEIQRAEADERQNLTYRGQTWQEHLDEEGIDEEGHREKNRLPAELRVKAGLVLSEVAELEGITVSRPELDEQLEKYRQQYTDAGMQAELDKPETRREISSRLMSDKTIKKLTSYTTAK
jgi:trigger factor